MQMRPQNYVAEQGCGEMPGRSEAGPQFDRAEQCCRKMQESCNEGQQRDMAEQGGVHSEADTQRCPSGWLTTRAQLTIGFMISAMMFVGLVLYTTSTVFNVINPYFNAAGNQESEAYAYMVSTLLLSDTGQWGNATWNGTDWENHPQEISSLGLANSYYRLSLPKISNMSALSDAKIRSLLGEGHLYSFCIESVYAQDCGIMNKTGQAFDGMLVTRYAVVENGTQTIPARLVIEVL